MLNKLYNEIQKALKECHTSMDCTHIFSAEYATETFEKTFTIEGIQVHCTYCFDELGREGETCSFTYKNDTYEVYANNLNCAGVSKNKVKIGDLILGEDAEVFMRDLFEIVLKAALKECISK